LYTAAKGSFDPMLSLLDGFRLSQHPSHLFQHMQGHQPVASFRRSVSSSVRSSGKAGSEEVFESRVEETDGCGLKRIVVERGLGHKAMRLTQVSDGAGGTTEERVFTNVSKEEESLFDDSNWLQAMASSKSPAISVQAPVKSLPASSTAPTPQNVVNGSTLKAADAAATPADPEVDEHGVPISGSFAATEDGNFQATATASNSTPEMQPQDQQGSEQQKEQEQGREQKQEKEQEQEQRQKKEQHSPTHGRHRSRLDIDPFLRQMLSVQRMSRAFDPFYSWPFERPLLPRARRCYDFVPVRDPFDVVMLNRPLLDVWG
jgi:hypothetical protein